MDDDEYKVDVPEGKSGIWTIARFSVSEKDAEFDAMRGMFSGGGMGRHTPVGTYTSLHRGGTIVMSDTPDEIRDHRRFMRNATGNVLIAGLGLGMVLQGVARKPDVTHVTVVEKSIDVVNLVEAHYKAKDYGHKVEIVCHDIFDYKPSRGQTFDHGWIDIWDNLCTDNLDEMTKLSRRFIRSIKNKGYWGKELLLRRREHEKRNDWYGRR
jgi:hypothetical protein